MCLNVAYSCYILREETFLLRARMTEYWLETRKLCRYYQRGPQEVRAVDRVDICLDKGGFLGVVGSSGAGKSTLLNLLAGLDQPTSGLVVIDGVSLDAMSRRELALYRAHRIGMIFQSINLIPHYSALRNVELALAFQRLPDHERRKRARQALEKLGLSDRLDHRPADLSGGEQQRVAIARALVKEPELILADEPTGNLDHTNSEQTAALLADLNRSGMTVILVTHDLDLAGRYASRIIKMHYGRVITDNSGIVAGEGGDEC